MSGQSAFACEDGGCDHEGKNAVAPKRPKQQRKGGQSLPVQHHRRSLNLGPTADHQQISSESGSRSFSGSRSHPQEEGSVRVVVRVRPLSEEEEKAGGNRIVRCCNPKLLEFIPGFSTTAATSFGVGSIDGDSSAGLGTEGRRAYSFDLCAHEGFSQKEMFESCGLMPLLSAAVDGYAGTVLAYGATGAGKTYTMSGRDQVLQRGASAYNHFRREVSGIGSSTEGLISRSMRYLFQRIASLDSGFAITVRASYYEIYNELVYDLLAQQSRRPLQVRYGVKRGFFVQGLLEVEVRDLSDILAVMNEGNGNRRVSSHLLNKDSSRSHSLLSVGLHGQFKDPEDGHVVRTFGKVTFVDLAGSERLKKSRTANEKETASINKSLLTLGKVISTLSRRNAAAAASTKSSTPADDGVNTSSEPLPSLQANDNNNATVVGGVDQPSEIWVPYRESTLTKLLMDSLGGNGLTLMLACVSPSPRYAEETASTLNYAARARNIRNQPLVRIDARERLLNALRREVNLLREENDLLRRQRLAPPTHDAVTAMAVGGLDPGDDKAGSIAPQASPRTAGERGVVDEIVPPEYQPNEEQEEATAIQIGQAGQDVAALLRKYEEECHRLRREAALAQHKELEICKQTRQTLAENEALSLVVERLQRITGVKQSPRSSTTRITAPIRRHRGDTDVGVLSEMGVKENGGVSQQWPFNDSRTSGDENKGTRDSISGEVLHLRRVNEALVERLEAVERSHSKMSTAKVGVGLEGQMRSITGSRSRQKMAIVDRGGHRRSGKTESGKRTPPKPSSSTEASLIRANDYGPIGSLPANANRSPARPTRTPPPQQRDPRGRIIRRSTPKVEDGEPSRSGNRASQAIRPPVNRLVCGSTGGIGNGRTEGGRGLERSQRLGSPDPNRVGTDNGRSGEVNIHATTEASSIDSPPAASTADPNVEASNHQPIEGAVTSPFVPSEGDSSERTGEVQGAESVPDVKTLEHCDRSAKEECRDSASVSETPTGKEGEGGCSQAKTQALPSKEQTGENEDSQASAGKMETAAEVR